MQERRSNKRLIGILLLSILLCISTALAEDSVANSTNSINLFHPISDHVPRFTGPYATQDTQNTNPIPMVLPPTPTPTAETTRTSPSPQATIWNMHPIKLQAYQVNKSPIDYSFLVLPFGFSPQVEHIVCDDNGLCYDENSTVCGSCTPDPFMPTTKSPWLAWAQVPYQTSVIDPNAPLIHGTQFELTRNEFLRRHSWSELV